MKAYNMRLPVYLICAALVVATRSEDNGDLYGNILEPINVAEQEPVNYFYPKFSAKYKPDWNRISDTRFYLFPENSDVRQISPETRIKRAEFSPPRGSLSIVNSLDALRNKLVMEIARKKTQQGASRNRHLLQSFGKRAFYPFRNSARFINM